MAAPYSWSFTVGDATAPVLTVTATPTVLGPPNHKYRDVVTSVEVSDDTDPAPTVTLLSVTSNEPDNAKGLGDGNTINDIVVVDDRHFKLRAERAEGGTGRIYTITYQATDSSGNSATASVEVSVPIHWE